MTIDRPMHPPEAFVPDEYRSARLPESVREFVDRKASVLAEAYELAVDGYEYEDEKARLLKDQDDHFKWVGDGSERTIACLGRTFEGKFIYAGDRGVVIKFTPLLRLRDDEDGVTVVRENGNLHELAVWKYVVDEGDAGLFAPILDYSEKGDWLAQKEVLPVYRYGSPTHANRSIDYLRENIAGTSYCDALHARLVDRGYDPHTKDGNVGFQLASRLPVMIDYGAHFGVDGVDLTDYALEE